MDEVLRFLGAATVIFGGGYLAGAAAALFFGMRQGGLEALPAMIAAFIGGFMTWAVIWLWVFL
jgi:hypothetical protein